MCSSVSSTTVQSWRERSPSSYSLKIQNFSQLKKSTLSSDGKYQSHLFSSGEHNWRMIMYPKGNEKDNGSGFISMYVEIDNTSLMSTSPTEVFADLRFFIFNKKENKYFTIQDVESKPFNTLRKLWGLPQVLPLETFDDQPIDCHKNGYVFEGNQCEFGVDVIVAPPNLLLYPKGDTRANGKWLSIYLQLADNETLKEDEKIFARANLRVLDPLEHNHVTKKIKHWHTKSNLGWGFAQLVSVAELRKVYLDKEGSLNVEIEFDVVSETNSSPII